MSEPGSSGIESGIAVVGMAARLPGASTIAEFWSNLRNGVESVTPFTDDELRAAGVPESLINDPDYVKSGAILDGMELFDAGFFGFSSRDATIMDPQHRQFLEVAWEAIEDAAIDPSRFDGSIGVFAGTGMHTYMMFNLLSNRELMDSVGMFLVRHTGNDKDFVATRVSYAFNLTGPSINVQTACSTSLVSIHLACQSLLNGECDAAVAGGATIEVPHRHGYLYKEGEILSPDGHCRPFDKNSQGTIFGSGLGAVVLRRLEDAIEHGEPIHAVIRGSAVNNDGSQKVGYLAPSVDGQAKSIAEALQISEVDARTISYVEAHGTGTPVGDPIELTALTQAFRLHTDERGFCRLGSVKANIGHLDTAAGIAGFIKVIEAMKHRELPPTINYTGPNPILDLESSPFVVNAELVPWNPPSGVPRRAGVSSLGVGGTNAHIILEEAPVRRVRSSASRKQQLLLVSAKTKNALANNCEALGDALRTDAAPALADVAYTLQVGRTHFAERRFVVAADAADAADVFEREDTTRVVSATAPDSKRSVAFMFAGGGAQYPNMGLELYETERVYREAVDACLDLLQPSLDFDLRAVLFPAASDTERAAADLERPSRALPALFITQYAQAQLWMSWGVSPAAAIGHSMGEYTAACLSGVLALADALGVVALRGRLFEQVPAGAMLSVALDAEALHALLPDDLSIAAANAPQLSVAAGPVASINALERTLTSREIECQRIHIAVAAHSSMLEPILEEFGAHLRRLTYGAPSFPVISNLSGRVLTAEEAGDPQYWVRHLRQTVRFAEGVAELLKDSSRVLLEVGPGRTLASLSRMHAATTPAHTILTSMRHPEEDGSDVAFALGTLGHLWTAGVAIDWDGFYRDETREPVQLPAYQWEHAPYWMQPVERHDVTEVLDERRADMGEWLYEPTWRRSPLPAGAGAAAQRILVFDAAGTLSAPFVSGAQASGHEVLVVRPGSDFAAADATFTIRRDHADDYQAMVAALGERGALPDAIVYFAPHAAPTDDLDVALGGSFFSLLYLAQALGAEDVSTPMRLLAVSSGAQQVAGEAMPSPTAAAMHGPCRVIPREFPNVECRAIDLAGPAPGTWQEHRLAGMLLAELARDVHEAAVAYRGVERFAMSYERNSGTTSDRSTLPLRDGGVYLITGGLGGLGLLFADYLAETAHAKIILVGRSGLTPSKADRVRALEEKGAQVLVAKADVTDEARMAEVVAEATAVFGPINGVLHAAGVLDDGPAQLKTTADVRRVLEPKIKGTLVLDAVLRGTALDFVVLFSSVSAVVGPAGQIDYSAANAFLDAYAHARQACDGTRTVAVNWPAWRQVGMAAELLGDGSAPLGEGEHVPHPLFDRRIRRGAAEEIFSTAFSVDTHWVLKEHRIRGGSALIPGAGYLELARAAFAIEQPSRPVEMSDVFFMAPFVVSDSETRELQVHLTRTNGSTEFVMRSPVGGGHAGWHEHVRGTVADASPPSGRHDVSAILARCTEHRETFTDSNHDPHLQFGPRWASLKRVDYGTNEAVATLEVADEYVDDLQDYRLHPAVIDMATAGAQRLITDYDPATDFYVPIGYTQLRFSGTLPRKLYSHIRYRASSEDARDVAVFDVTLMDETGAEVVAINEFMMQRVVDKTFTVVQPGSPDGDAESHGTSDEALERALELGIDAREGVAVFERILASSTGPQVLVSPYPYAYLRDRLTAPLGATVAPAARQTFEEDPELDTVVATLLEHAAVRDARVLARLPRPGERRVVAYVLYRDGEQATVSELRRHAKRHVAQHLIPASFIELDEFPLRDDGAVDLHALPDPFGVADEYVAPRTNMEKRLAAVWQEVLGIDRVGVHDNFFDIGGHSLLSIRVITRLHKQIGVRLNQAIMVLQTLEQVAKECEQRLQAAEAPSAAEPSGEKGLSAKLLHAVKSSVFQS
ncbi:MAG TPA: SDR family NAD(P)-dependent oxidoreductase [Gemmatimonadales bacterium]